MERPMRREVGLLDLPAKVLCHILSFLDTVSQASVRLTCRGLWKAATREQRLIPMGCTGLPYVPLACASPEVLHLKHTFDVLFTRLAEEGVGADASSASSPEVSAFEQFVMFLKKEFLMNVASEVQSLVVEPGWSVPPVPWMSKVALRPDIFLARTRQLKRLRLSGPLDSAILQQLATLRHLTLLELEHNCFNKDLQAICSELSLSHLSVFFTDKNGKGFEFQQTLEMLASGGWAGLQGLALLVPAAEARQLSRLTSLTALASLKLDMLDTLADLGGLAGLTGLKDLTVGICNNPEEVQPIGQSLSPLAALTGLTCLDLSEFAGSERIPRSLLSDVSVLSSLPALRVLRCGLFEEAKVLAKDPLPIQFRFLRSATALEELQLRFRGSFWSLPHASSLAMREAVSALTCLKRVKAGDCFKALAKLRSLTLRADDDIDDVDTPGWDIPGSIDLIAGLPSTHLTYLEASVNAEPHELTQQLARFCGLQVLELRLPIVDSSLLDQLSNLKCLTQLVLNLMDENGYLSDLRTIHEHVAQLKTAICERARLVGVKPSMQLTCPGLGRTHLP